MRFTVLGSGTALPDSARGPAGFLVEVGDCAWLVDGGSGTLAALARRGVDPIGLAGGFYSHRHLDHTGDFAPLLFAMRVGRRQPEYPVWAGEGFSAFVGQLRGAYGDWIAPGAGGLRVTELPLDGPGEVALGGLRVVTAPAVHSAGALHLRFEAEGRAVVFSGDTAASEALVALAAGADLLVCECGSAASAPVPGHLAPEEVAALARRSAPREIWLTHFYPGSDPAAACAIVAGTGVPTRRAEDGDSWEGCA